MEHFLMEKVSKVAKQKRNKNIPDSRRRVLWGQVDFLREAIPLAEQQKGWAGEATHHRPERLARYSSSKMRKGGTLLGGSSGRGWRGTRTFSRKEGEPLKKEGNYKLTREP